MELDVNFEEMVVYDFYAISSNVSEEDNNYVTMSDECYQCQECYYR